MRLAIVVTAYKINQAIIDRFFRYTHHQNIIIVTDKRAYPPAMRLQCPNQDKFSITKTANIGIRYAVDQGYDVIVKTDIDCMLTPEVVTQCELVSPGHGFCFRYWHIDDYKPLSEAQMGDRCIGTMAMTSVDWEALQGYNEHMFGYGYDDYEIMVRARKKLINIDELMQPKVYHFAHEKHNIDTINPINHEYNMVNRHNYNNPEWGVPKE